jgi:gliding motility-associated-like protein
MRILPIFLLLAFSIFTIDLHGQCTGEPIVSFELASTVNPSCNGSNDGEITVTLEGGEAPFSYFLVLVSGTGISLIQEIQNTTDQSVTFSGLFSNSGLGSYKVTVYTSNNTTGFPPLLLCSTRETSNIDLPQPDLLEIAADITDECTGENSGEIILNISGGTRPYEIRWTGPTAIRDNEVNPTGLSPGTYRATVTDSEECTLTETLEVEPRPEATISATGPTTICFGETTTLQVAVNNGTGPYTVVIDTTGANTLRTINNYNVGDNIIIAPTVDATYSLVSVTDSEGCSASVAGSELINVNPKPTANDQTPTACEDVAGSGTAVVDLTSLNAAIDGGAGHTINWYSDAALTSPVGDPANETVSNGSVYYAQVDDGSCTNVATATYTVNGAPEANDQTPTACEDVAGGGTAVVDLTSLNAAIDGGAGHTINWYSDAALTSPVGDPANETVSNGLVYYAQVDNGTCTSIATANYTVNSLPTANNQTPTACEDAVGNGTAVVDLASLNAAIDGGAGHTINWYSDAALTSPVGDPANETVSNGSVYYAQVDNGTCTSIATANYTVNSLPTANNQTPTACEDVAGSGTAVVDLTSLNAAIDGGAGHTINWYSDAALTSPVGDPANETVSNGSVYYAQVDDGSCTNVATATYTVNGAPEANDQTPTACEDVAGGGTAVVDLTSLNAAIDGGAGHTINWYSDAALTSPVGDPANETVSNGLVYYAQVDNGTCTSIATANYTVNSLPTANNQTPTACEDVVGNGTAVVDLTSLNAAIDGGAGHTINWYSDAALTSPVGDPANETVSNGSVYYAQVDDGSCTNVATATYTVNGALEANDQTPTACEDVAGGGTAVVDLTSLNAAIDGGAGHTINWYSDAALTSPVGDPANETVSNGSVYYAQVDDGSCTNVATATYTVNGAPEANDQTPTACEDVAGSGTAVVDLTSLNAAIDGGAGHTINWYSDAALTSPVGDPANETVSNGLVYYAQVDDGSCTNVATATYTVNGAPEANDQTPTACEDVVGNGTAVVDLTSLNAAIDGGAGHTINWYSDAALTSPVGDPANETVSNGSVYYAQVDNGTCTSIATANYTVNSLPTANNQTPTACEDVAGSGTAVVDLTSLNAAIDGGAGHTINWYSDAALTSPVGDPANETVSNGSVYYAQVDDGSCTNVATATYTVNGAPEANDQTPTACEDVAGGGTAVVDLTSLNAAIDGGAGHTINWYSDAALTSPVGDPANETVSNGSVYYAQVDNGTCTSIATANYTVNSLPTANNQTPTACEDVAGGGRAVVDLTSLNAAIDGGAGHTINWYSDAALTSPVGDPANETVSNGSVYYAQVDDGSCTNVATATYTVNGALEANDQTPTACEDVAGGGTAVVDLTSLNAAIDGGAGHTINWYSDAALTSPVGDPANETVSNGSVYYAQVDDGSCTNVATATYTVNGAPEANDQTPTACEDVAGSGTAVVDLTSLNAAIDGGAGHTINWYSDAALTSPVGDPANETVSNGLVYYAQVDNGTCTGIATANYTVNSLPTANNQTPTACEDVVGNGTAVVDLASLNAAIDGGAGHTINWYSDAALTSPVGDPANETVSNGSVYYAQVDNGTCTSIATANYTVNSLPTANNQTPTACEDVAGSGTAVVDLTSLNAAIDGGAGHTINWYSDAALTSPVGDPANETVSNRSVYYAQVDDGSCTNVATATYTVNGAPEANDQTPTACEDVAGGGTAVVDLTSLNAAIDGGAGHTINWYSDAALTSPVGDPANETVSNGSVYYAQVDNGTCTSIATANYTVNSLPTANNQTPTACEDVVGNGTAVVDLTSLNAAIDGGAGHTINWYSDAALTSPVGDPANETVSNGSVYYAQVDDGSCTNVATATYTVNGALEANDQTPTACEDVAGGGTAVVDLTSLNAAIDGGAGHTINWYSDAALTSPVGDPANETVSNGSVYYAQVDNGTCTSIATANYTVNSLPTANNQTPTACEDVAGGGTAVVDLTSLNAAIDGGAGHTINWYSDAALTSPVGDPANETVSNGSVYYAQVDNGTCTSIATANYTVNSLPTANNQTPTACEDVAGSGTAVVDLTSLNAAIDGGAGHTINWYSDAALTSPVGDPANETVSNGSVYYAQVDDGSCTNVATVTYVEINLTPATPTASNNGPTCQGGDIQLSTPEVAGATYSWTGPNDFSSNLREPLIENVTAVSVGTYYVTLTVGLCTSAPGSTEVEINPNPLPTATLSGDASICPGQEANLTVELTGVAPWTFVYSDGTNNFAEIIASSPFTIPVTPMITTTYSAVSVVDANCTGNVEGTALVQVSPAKEVTINIDEVAEIPGEEVSVPVRLVDFENLMSMQFTVIWDEALLQYDRIANINLGNIGDTSFGLEEVANGKLSFAWSTASFTDTVIVDNTVIFDIVFTIPATVLCSDAPITVDESREIPRPILFTDENLCHANVMVDGGNVDIQATVSISSSDDDNLICFGELVTFTALPGGLANYDFYLNGGIVQSGASNVYVNSSLVDEDLINVIISDAQSCALSANGIVTNVNQINISPDITPISGCGGSDGAIELTITGGSGNYAYLWSGPGIVAGDETNKDQTGLIRGFYQVTVTDNVSSCVESLDIELKEPVSFTLSAEKTDVSTTGGSDGSIDLTITGGTGPFQINWTGPNEFISTEQDLTDLFAGTYTATVTDLDNGCTDAIVVEITQPISGLVLNATKTDVSTCGAMDGTINLSVEGGSGNYEVSWTGPNGFTSNDQNLTELEGGQYVATVIDRVTRLTAQWIVVVAEPDGFFLEALATDIVYCNSTDGTINLTVTGGSGDFAYQWRDLSGLGFTSTDEDISDLAQGIYRAVVTDNASGCMDSIDAEVGRPAICELPCGLMVESSTNNTSCPDTEDGAAVINIISGGSGPGNYYVSVDTGKTFIPFLGQDITTIIDRGQGSYLYIVRDTITGCSDTTIANVGISTNLLANVSVSDAGCTEDDGTITFNVSGGLVPFEVEIIDADGNVTSQTGTGFFEFDNLIAGEYLYNVREQSGCEIVASDALVVGVDCGTGCGSLVASARDFEDATCATEPNGKAVIDVLGGSSPYEYSVDGVSWTPFISGNAIEFLPPDGTYNIAIRQDADNADCRTTVSVTINGPDEIVLETPIITTQKASCNQFDGVVKIGRVVGGTGSYTYQIDEQFVTLPADSIIDELKAGMHTFSVIDEVACQADFTFEVESPGVVIATIVDIPVNCDAIDQKAGLRIEIDFGLTTLPGPYSAAIAKTNDPDNITVYEIPDNGILTVLGLDKDFYTVDVSSGTDGGCTYTESVGVFGGAYPVAFEIIDYDTIVSCVDDLGYITIGNVTGDPDTTFIVQLLSGSSEILETYQVDILAFEGGFTIDESNSDKIVAGNYFVRIIQNQDDCAGVAIVSDLIVIAEPTGVLGFEVLSDAVSVSDRPTGNISGEVLPSGGNPYEARIQLIEPLLELNLAEIRAFNARRKWDVVPPSTDDLNRYPHVFDTLWAGTYEIGVRDIYGCEYYMEHSIGYDENIFIPNIFTPNGDGFNDTFYIRNLPESGTQIVITNRSGFVVFQSDDYNLDNFWDGGDVADGVYYYNVKTVNGESYKGWVEKWSAVRP